MQPAAQQQLSEFGSSDRLICPDVWLGWFWHRRPNSNITMWGKTFLAVLAQFLFAPVQPLIHTGSDSACSMYVPLLALPLLIEVYDTDYVG